jgi:hypothetical protein
MNSTLVPSFALRLVALAVVMTAVVASTSTVAAQESPLSNLAVSLSTDLLDPGGFPIPPDDRVYEVGLTWVASPEFDGQFDVFELGAEIHPGGSLVATLPASSREFTTELPFPTQPVCYRVEAKSTEGAILGQVAVCTEAPPTTGASPTPGAPTTGTSSFDASPAGALPEVAFAGAALLAVAVAAEVIRRAIVRQV